MSTTKDKKETKKADAKPIAAKLAVPISKKEKVVRKEALTQKEVAAKSVEEKTESADKIRKAYIYAVGRRKSATAQIKLYKKGEGKVTVNKKPMEDFFPHQVWQFTLLAPLRIVGQRNKLNIVVKVTGGGKQGQSEAIRHGIARALLGINPNFRKPLKKNAFLMRDARVKERKKPGLKRARRAPQWQKR